MHFLRRAFLPLDRFIFNLRTPKNQVGWLLRHLRQRIDCIVPPDDARPHHHAFSIRLVLEAKLLKPLRFDFASLFVFEINHISEAILRGGHHHCVVSIDIKARQRHSCRFYLYFALDCLEVFGEREESDDRIVASSRQ